MKRPGMNRCWPRIPVVAALAVCLGATAALGQEVVYPDPAKDGTILPIPAPAYPPIGFPEESEKFCTLDDISLLDKHLRELSKDAAYMRIRASGSHDAST